MVGEYPHFLTTCIQQEISVVCDQFREFLLSITRFTENKKYRVVNIDLALEFIDKIEKGELLNDR